MNQSEGNQEMVSSGAEVGRKQGSEKERLIAAFKAATMGYSPKGIKGKQKV